MSDQTGIEWTDATWNPTTGCDKVSPGCDHCYAMTLAPRLKAMGSAHYQTDGDPRTSGPGFGVAMHPDSLDWPLRKRKPLRIFVNSMSDLFHARVSDDFIADVFGTMAANYQWDRPTHTFQLLTKRHGRMRSLLSSDDFRWAVAKSAAMRTDEGHADQVHDGIAYHHWPLPNVHLGVSAENQRWAVPRIEALMRTPAAVRFVSAEPLLGPIEYGEFPAVDWVIVGGESGRGARPMHPDWARSLRDQCQDAGIPFLFKQWGGHDEYGTPMPKKASGRVLDGRTWDEFPAVAA